MATMEVARRTSQQNENEEEMDSQNVASFVIEFPLVIYVQDSLFNNSGKFQILPFKQTGINLPGHYLKIDGSKVSASATWNDQNSIFNIYTVVTHVNNNQGYIEIIESASDPKKVLAVVNDKVVVKTCQKPPQSYSTLKDVQKHDPEILWVYEPLSSTSDYGTYRLYTTGSTNYYLAFGSNGKPLTPSTVDPIRDEAYFNEQRVS